jgi:hypothetical protein
MLFKLLTFNHEIAPFAIISLLSPRLKLLIFLLFVCDRNSMGALLRVSATVSRGFVSREPPQ